MAEKKSEKSSKLFWIANIIGFPLFYYVLAFMVISHRDRRADRMKIEIQRRLGAEQILVITLLNFVTWAVTPLTLMNALDVVGILLGYVILVHILRVFRWGWPLRRL